MAAMTRRSLVRLVQIGLGVCWLAAACSGAETPRGGAQLLQDVTLAPVTPFPTRILSATPSPVVIPVTTSELVSPLEVITLAADFVLVTPTLPPSKTPTLTLTATLTPTAPRPTLTLPPTQPSLTLSPLGVVAPPRPILPTAISVPPVVAQPCSVAWFFAQPIVPGCPLNPPLVSEASYQQFQNGFMLWVQQQDAIYVLYDSANPPRWQAFPDQFETGMPETDPAYDNPPPYAWQPRRGFGLVWRTRPELRSRLGWAVIEWETVYTAQAQIGADGTLYISEPRGGIFSLMPGGVDWKRYIP